MVQNKYRHAIITSIIVIVFLLILIAVFFSPNTKKNTSPQSTFELNPSVAVSPTREPEPFVTSWRNYSNDKYNFAIDVPSDWHEQEIEVPGTEGGLLVAFSPNDLPCKTCSYVYDGFYSIKIYNQQTDPQSYAAFIDRANSVGKKEGYQAINLDGIKGVWFQNTLSAQNHGWVYELSLDKDQGQANITESLIFKKALNSFRFTYLLFNE